MSKRSQAKGARRRKRQAAHDARWVPEQVVQELAAQTDSVVADLAEFDERITQRGWTFDEDESNDDYAIWFYEPSGAPVEDGLPVTSLWLDAAEDGELVHLVFVGTDQQQTLTHDALFEELDAIEAYRLGEPLPQF